MARRGFGNNTWLDKARHGEAMRGKTRHDMARILRQHKARQGEAWPGKAWQSMARHGKDFKHNKPPQHSIRHAGGYAPAANDSPVVFLEG